ncbi:unnamed protein product [Ilex paraguariensis]|uniref:RRM domain-containing protein n=1 Tax=Ilex paraguariensis TaxID=185542 RepID=A0ABC8T3B9_9AQUA
MGNSSPTKDPFPLSGPLVIAEVLGKKKSSPKPNKDKDQAKDRYLFKRRDELNEFRSHQTNKGQASSFTQPVYVEGSSAFAAGEYVLQKRASAVSVRPEMSAKHEHTGTISKKGASSLSRDVTAKEAEKHAVTKFSRPGLADDMPYRSQSSTLEGFQLPSTLPAAVEEWDRHKQVQYVHSGAHVLAAPETQHHDEGSRVIDSGGKKAKVRKRPVAELNNEHSVPVEKKKRKKEMGIEMNSDHGHMRTASGKSGTSVGMVSEGTSVQGALSPREDFQVDQQKKDNGASTLLLDCTGSQQTVGIDNIEMDLPQLLSYLQALALNPFHGVGRSPAIIRQVFLRFRSLVYQKSLALLPPADSDSNESWASKSPEGNIVTDNNLVENVRDLPSSKPLKPSKQLVRSEDPTKAGQKRGPSDRQEEMAAKRKKKINDVKLLVAEKKASQKIPEAQRADIKERVFPAPAKASSKKADPPMRAHDPTMLVMKFPPRGTLPSLSELKARFARFGPLDHSGTRVFWKSSTCRVVYLHKIDAQAACKFAMGSGNLFGNTNVRCHIRELGAPASELESAKVQREDPSAGTPYGRDSLVEQRSATALTTPILQQPVQLKSCLKKLSGDEAVAVTGGGGGGRGARVKFMLGGEESSRGEQLIGSKNFNNASFADGGASSSSLAMDFNSKNFEKVIPPSQSPVLPLPSVQFPKAQNNMHYTELAPRNMHNFNTPTNPPQIPGPSNIDIAQQMLSLLTKCNDVVANLTASLGYVPYHPL